MRTQLCFRTLIVSCLALLVLPVDTARADATLSLDIASGGAATDGGAAVYSSAQTDVALLLTLTGLPPP